MITRRSFLRVISSGGAMVAAGALLAACGGAASGSPAAAPASNAPASSAAAAPASSASAAPASSAPASSASAAPASSAAASPAASASSAAASGGQVQTIKEQLLWIEDVEFGGDFAAIQQGFDKAAGIERTLIPGGPQVDAIKAVAGGAAPMGLIGGSDSLNQARANGVPVKAFATYFQKAPAGVMSLAKNPIKTPQDAIGKKIGLQAGARPAWEEIVAVNKLPADKITIVPVGLDATPLVSGQVDGYWAYAFNQPLSLNQKGIDTVMMLAWDAGVKSYGDVVFALDSVISQQEDLLVRWLQATVRGWQFFLKSPTDIAKLAVQRSPALKLDQQQQDAQAKAQVDFLKSPLTDQKGLLWVDPTVFSQGIDLLLKTNQIKTQVKVDDVVTTSILEKAFGGKTTL